MTEGQELVIVEPSAPLTVFGTNEPTAIVNRVTAIAQPLAAFIKQQRMSTNISGREYVLAEGWSFMGAMLGVAPRTVSVSDLRDSDGLLIGFEANVELVTRDGAVVGGAIAECSRSERNWSDRDDFALKSMAQTRATGKAYRMAFGFVMKAAGYEATPAEEMAYEADERTGPRPQRTTPSMAYGQRPAITGDIQNVGQLLTWAVQDKGKSKAWVLETLGVKAPTDITDFADAKAALEIALEAE